MADDVIPDGRLPIIWRNVIVVSSHIRDEDMKSVFFAALLAGMASTYAAAEGTQTGQDLYTNLQNYEKGTGEFYSIISAGYVIGVADAVNGDKYCRPERTTNAQLLKVTSNYLGAHPERWAEIPAPIVIDAFKAAWPCPWAKYANPK
jgi:hypothetical protein